MRPAAAATLASAWHARCKRSALFRRVAVCGAAPCTNHSATPPLGKERQSAGPEKRFCPLSSKTADLWRGRLIRRMAKALYKDREHEVGDICNSLHISRSTLYRYLALPDG